MKFEWNEQKNRTNYRKHGIAFESVLPLFEDEVPLLIELDDRQDYDEDRWVGLGPLKQHVVVVVFTEPEYDTIRLISARKANQHERQKYLNALGN